ncbi:MAG: glycosyltransferase [Flavobacteriales bacterium]|jgi:sugar transferase (PEP-CTERM/EpsH1 system associated)|nr:glycosyltransferase [Flavobacteriales bacterium]
MKLFVIVSRVPYPLDKGDKLRVYHQLKELSKRHNILLCCLDDNHTDQEHIDHLKSFCHEVKVFRLNKLKIYFNLFKALFSSKPYQVNYFYQANVHRKISQLIQSYQPDRIFCQLIRAAEYVKNEHHIVKTLDYMDAFSKGIDRRTPYSGILKPLFKEEAKRLLKYEHLIYDYFDQHSIISEKERQLIYHQKRDDITIVTNGIDTDFFQAMPHAKKFDLIFVGNMSYAPNVAAVQYIVNEILPLLSETITLKIAGANPAKEVKALANKNVVVSGWVDDIREAYASAKIFVAPLFIGTGLQNKLLEAMAMELPCITTSLVNNSLGAKDSFELEVAETAEDFAVKINSLLTSHDRRVELGEKARSFVKSTYSWEESTKKLEAVIEKKGI